MKRFRDWIFLLLVIAQAVWIGWMLHAYSTKAPMRVPGVWE